ncbi:hypothetical protein M3Y99_01666000 [Aphelenchoides fujianensis]|nr:hypothetical protein M3Y99_01666000 [Aphelenchoides fujianensis]
MSEEVVARKLLADGDGTGEDKRLVQLFGFYQKLAANPNDAAVVAQIELSLQQAELGFQKQTLAADICDWEVQQVRELAEKVEAETLVVEGPHRRRQGGAGRRARRPQKPAGVRRAGAQRIDEQPSRSETTARLRKLDAEIEELLNQRNELEAKLAEKRKTIALAFACLDEAGDCSGDDVTTTVKEEGEEDFSDVEMK